MAIDEDWNQYILEFNHIVRLKFSRTLSMKNVYNEFMNIILNSYKKVNREYLWKFWKNYKSSNLDLGEWEIIYNEASGYDFLKESISKY